MQTKLTQFGAPDGVIRIPDPVKLMSDRASCQRLTSCLQFTYARFRSQMWPENWILQRFEVEF